MSQATTNYDRYAIVEDWIADNRTRLLQEKPSVSKVRLELSVIGVPISAEMLRKIAKRKKVVWFQTRATRSDKGVPRKKQQTADTQQLEQDMGTLAESVQHMLEQFRVPVPRKLKAMVARYCTPAEGNGHAGNGSE